MKKLIFLLLICIAVMLTGCPKSTPKQPEVFKRFNGKEAQVIEKFDNELAKYECLMSGRNWAENSIASTDQQRLAKLEAEEMQINQKLQSLATEINKIQQDYSAQENNLLDESDKLERKLLLAKRQEYFAAEIRNSRQNKVALELELQRTSRRRTRLRNDLQRRIDSLQQSINELVTQLQNEPSVDASSDVIELELRQLEKRRDRNKTFAENQIKQKEAEKVSLSERSEQNARERRNLATALGQQRNPSPPEPQNSGGQMIYAECANGGNGQPTDAQKLLARTVRDNLIYDLIRFTDYQYFRFENDLYIKRASGSFLADVLDTGANFAGAITNGERAKTIISAAVVAFRGGRKSASIHYFQEQTADILITKMQTARNRILAEMIEKLNTQGVSEYPLNAALGDVIDYFYAGTLPRALQELREDTNIDARIAKRNVREVSGLSEPGLVTKERRENSREAFVIKRALASALNDPEKKAEAVEKLRSIVEELEKDETLKKDLTGQNVSSKTDDGQKIIDALNEISDLKDEAGDSVSIAKIDDAIVKFGKLTKEENK